MDISKNQLRSTGQKYVKTCHEGGLVAKIFWRLKDLEPRFLKLVLLFEIPMWI
jgi:hypothetical protein